MSSQECHLTSDFTSGKRNALLNLQTCYNQRQQSHNNNSELTTYWLLQLEGPSPSNTLCNFHYVQAKPGAGEGAGWVVLNIQQVSLEWQWGCPFAPSLCNDLHNEP
jgi:hypothetical protein